MGNDCHQNEHARFCRAMMRSEHMRGGHDVAGTASPLVDDLASVWVLGRRLTQEDEEVQVFKHKATILT